MPYDFIAIPDADVPQAVDPTFQHVLATYASETKWKPLILFFLKGGPRRFSDLRRSVSDVTQKMLTDRLRELERDGIIHREV